MKKQLMKCLLVALMLAPSVKAFAQEGPRPLGGGGEPSPHSFLVQNKVGTGRSAWVTVYNMFGSIREAACVRDGQERPFENYMQPLTYMLRAEIKSNVDCSGQTIGDVYSDSYTPTVGLYAKILSYPSGGRDDYMWRVTMSPNAKHREAPILGKDNPTQEPISSEAPQSPGGQQIAVHNAVRTGKTVWATIYNGFGSIRDSGCVQVGQEKLFSGYIDFGMYWKVRLEVKDGPNCSGATIRDIDTGFKEVGGGVGVRILNLENGDYITAIYH